MWLLVMFDLPVGTAGERKEATQFRKILLDLGFEMTQFSVYTRFSTSHAQTAILCDRVEEELPEGGRVHVLQFTDKQFERAKTYRGKQRMPGKKAPEQFELF
jgi:CRISPR-associated protein Cas2